MNIRKRMSRLLAMVLTAAALLALAVPAWAVSVGDFQDVSSGDWFYDAVDFVVGRGLFNGAAPDRFNPNGRMTRGMFIAVLGRYARVDASAWLTGAVTGSDVNLRSGPGTDSAILASMAMGTNVTITGKSGSWYKVSTAAGDGYVSGDYVKPDYHGFKDVDYGQYYAGYAVWAYEKGIVNGVGSVDAFAPDSTITREQMCTMLSRFASVMGASLAQSQGAVSFTDGGSISAWAADSVTAMQRAGIVKGDSAGTFRPRGSATRAETATMLQRFESACGGLNPPSQNPPAKSEPQTGGGSGSDNNTTPPESTPPQSTPDTPPQGGGAGTTPPTPTPDTSGPADTPATLIDGTVGTKGNVIRVGLYYKTNSYDTSAGPVTLQNNSGAGFELGTMPGRDFSYEMSIPDSFVTVTTDGSSLTVSGSSGSYTYSGSFAIRPSGGGQTCVDGGNSYAGSFELRVAANGRISLINIVDFEQYLKGVLPCEFPSTWPTEALKAAAIACRSFAMSYNWNTYAPYGMDILDGSSCQVYRGCSAETAAADAAVEATRNLYLTYQGGICVTAYSSCNGGRVHSGLEVFGVDTPYLQSKDDPYEQAIAGQVNNYNSWVNASHKAGMSAWGCYAMANNFGKTYDAILGFYYPGTNLQYGA